MRVVLLTGASHGIGLATAAHLGKAGYKVYATCRDPDSASDLRKLAETNPNITVMALDVIAKQSVKAAVASILAREGRIDVLINNAGMGIYGPAETLKMKEIKQKSE